MGRSLDALNVATAAQNHILRRPALQRGLSLLSKVGRGLDALIAAIAAQNHILRCSALQRGLSLLSQVGRGLDSLDMATAEQNHILRSPALQRGLRAKRHNVCSQLLGSQTLAWPVFRRPSWLLADGCQPELPNVGQPELPNVGQPLAHNHNPQSPDEGRRQPTSPRCPSENPVSSLAAERADRG